MIWCGVCITVSRGSSIVFPYIILCVMFIHKATEDSYESHYIILYMVFHPFYATSFPNSCVCVCTNRTTISWGFSFFMSMSISIHLFTHVRFMHCKECVVYTHDFEKHIYLLRCWALFYGYCCYYFSFRIFAINFITALLCCIFNVRMKLTFNCEIDGHACAT